ncbi:MAG: GGDEF domain-containing protein [Burkholderiales bacterium]
MLRLVKSSPRTGKAASAAPSAPPQASAYYQRIESYARKIRRSDDINVIINILDEALRETSALRHDDSVRLAREEVARTEQRIELLKREMEQLRSLIHFDHLTGTLNRSGLDQTFQREAAQADRHGTVLGVALLDIDDFKRLNDTHGHQAGDAVLAYLAQIMRKSLRPSDAVARYGGEEFLILFPHSGLEQAEKALWRLQEELAKFPYAANGTALPVAFSAGVTTRKSGESQAAVIARADQALYEAKRSGKRRVVVFD